jgi:hypothetical protein
MEFLQLEWVTPVLALAGLALGFWVLPNKVWAKIISFFGATLVPVLNKVDSLADGAAAMARGAGLEKVGDMLEALGDSADELEDPLRLLEEYTKDGKLDSTELKHIIEEAGEGAISVKVLVQSVIALIKKQDTE